MAPAREALEAELSALHEPAHAWALSLCAFSRERAVDVLQESYLRVLDGRAAFRGDSQFRTFLFGVIRQVAREVARRERIRDALSRLWLAQKSIETVEREFGEERVLRRALTALPRRQREVLVLVFWNDMTLEEAARVLAISVGSVRQHYARAKDALRRRLADEER